MSNYAKIFLGISAVIIIALAIWTAPLIFKKNGSNKAIAPTTQTQQGTDNGDMPKEKAPEVVWSESDEDGTEFLQISENDCKNECKEYSEETDLEYCRQICGLSAANVQSSGCEELKDLEKDYCLKDLAISAKNMPGCEKIEDNGIRKACWEALSKDKDLLDEDKKL
jgi:hypothetical protein